MNRYASRARSVAYTLIAGTFAYVVWPSSGAFAQDDAAPAASATSATPPDAASQSRRDRRRAAQAETTAAPAAPAAAAAPAASAAPAPGAASSAAAAPTAAAEPDGPTTICKNIKPLGTRMAKRVCGTPEQWAALESKTTDAASDDMRNVRSTGAVIATTPGPTSTP